MSRFVCEPCGFETDDKSNHDKHLLTTKHKRAVGQEAPPKKIYECGPCEYSTHNKRNFALHVSSQKHMEKTEGSDKNTCLVCMYKAKSREEFKKHCETWDHKILEDREETAKEAKIFLLAHKIVEKINKEDLFSARADSAGNIIIERRIEVPNIRGIFDVCEHAEFLFSLTSCQVSEKSERMSLRWRRKKYLLSANYFFLLVLEMMAVYHEKCDEMIALEFEKAKKEGEGMEFAMFPENGYCTQHRAAKIRDGFLVVADDINKKCSFFEQTILMRENASSKCELFCLWLREGGKFKKRIEGLSRFCDIQEKGKIWVHPPTAKITQENKFLRDLENYSVEIKGKGEKIEIVVAVLESISKIRREDNFENKKAAVCENLALSLYGKQKISAFSRKVIEKVLSLMV